MMLFTFVTRMISYFDVAVLWFLIVFSDFSCHLKTRQMRDSFRAIWTTLYEITGPESRERLGTLWSTTT